VFADDIPGLSRFRQGTDIPLATADHEYTCDGSVTLRSRKRLTLCRRRHACRRDYRDAKGWRDHAGLESEVRPACYGAYPHPSPGCDANALFVERLDIFDGIPGHVFRNAPVLVQGIMSVPDKPGLGPELDVDFIRQHDERE
jgi:L-alanine-DL-glutamate epimerase-like enolase superfamily enzyme